MIVYFSQMDVRARAIEAIGKKPIGVSWVDAFKTSGKHRNRVVAKEINIGGDPDMYAPAPLLEKAKMFLATPAAGEYSRRTNGRQRSQRARTCGVDAR